MILSAGLSPAWQQILTFDSLTIGNVNRAATAQWCASGKVLNVGRALHSLKTKSHTLCSIGGLPGSAIEAEFTRDAIAATWIETATATRVCTTIIDQSQTQQPVTPIVTELVENAPPISADKLRSFEEAYAQLVRSADIAILTGSLPEVVGLGKPVDLWARLMRHEIPVILDVRGPELLAALSLRPLLVKPNRDELAATVGRSLPDESSVVTAMRELIAAGAQWVLITDGGRPALLSNGEELWRLTPPVCAVVNPIGCGDCLAAGIAASLIEDSDMASAMVDAVRFGMAASVTNIEKLLPARLSLDTVEQRVQDVTIDRVVIT